MKTDDQLLAAVLSAPDDDAPRLVYADRLIQAGDPYGEYIACAIAGKTDRAYELERAYRRTWLHPLCRATQLGEGSFVFGRGFVEDVSLSLGSMPALAAILRLAPVRRLRLSSMLGLDWIETPGLERIRSLTVGMVDLPFGDAHATALGARAVALEELIVAPTSVSALGTGALARLPQLRRLELSGGELDDGAGDGLARAPALEVLELRSTQLGVGTLGALGAAPRLASLSVQLREPMFAAAAGAFESWRAPMRLRSLRVPGAAIGIPGLRALVASAAAASLVEIDLDNNQLGDEGARILANTAELPRLERLSLRWNRIRAQGGRALVVGSSLERLTHLMLRADARSQYAEANVMDASARKSLRRRFGDALDRPF
jgi:uncharacterized protein (TIGR02996 family)